jgi:hypothetical protein
MRLGKWLGVLALGLGLAGPAAAQQRSGFLTPITTIKNQVISTPDTGVPIAQPMTLPSSSNSLTRIFHRFSGTLNRKPVGGLSTYPTPGQLPGKDYLKSFGFAIPPRVTP